MGRRSASTRGNCAVSISSVRESIQVFGRCGIGYIHASRCPPSPAFLSLYSRCNICIISRTSVRDRNYGRVLGPGLVSTSPS